MSYFTLLQLLLSLSQCTMVLNDNYHNLLVDNNALTDKNKTHS